MANDPLHNDSKYSDSKHSDVKSGETVGDPAESPAAVTHRQTEPAFAAGNRRSEMPSAVGHSRRLPTMLYLLVALLLMLAVPPLLERVSYHMARGRQNAAREYLAEITTTGFSDKSRMVAEAISSSVVFIGTRGLISAEPERRTGSSAGQGSGVIVDEEGLILTNFHVIVGATKIVVQLDDGRERLASVVGVDEYTDLAVIKIEADGLSAAIWGDSDALQQGDSVWAVGSPYGLENSITFGIVSAKGRDGIGQSNYQDLVQTDAAVNPGNSGGALVNEKGELVGINTFIVGDYYKGISFAIPSNSAREVVEELKNQDDEPRGWLGVRLGLVSARRIEDPSETVPGAIVIDVLIDSPAHGAGIKRNDVIVRWQDTAVETARDLSTIVAETAPNTKAAVELIRDSERMTLEVTVGRLPKTILK